jgi:hypothetical protein
LALDGRADVYSLGCVLYECLTGERVFPRDSRLAEAWAHLEEEPPRPSRTRPGLPENVDEVIARALAKDPEERYPTCGALVAAAETALGLRRPPRLGTRAIVAVAAGVVGALLAASLAAIFVVLNASGSAAPAAPPRAHDNTLVRIDPRTNAMERVIDVGPDPAASAAWGHTLWVYSSRAGLVTEVDAATNSVLHKTPVSVTPPNLQPTGPGPVLAADQYGAWLVGIDRHGRSSLTRVPPGGGRPSYALHGGVEAVDTGLRAVWVIDRGVREDRLLRLDPATGTITTRAWLPASWQVDSLAVGYGDVWLVSASMATLYRIDPRSAGIDPRSAAKGPVHLACSTYGPQPSNCVESSTERPSAMFGELWVDVTANSGFVSINPTTLATDDRPDITGVNGVSVEAFDSAWTYDVNDGYVQRWNPSAFDPIPIKVTNPPSDGGSCLTSSAAAGDAVWVTLAPSVMVPGEGPVCNL